MEGLIFVGAYPRREICDTKPIGLAAKGSLETWVEHSTDVREAIVLNP